MNWASHIALYSEHTRSQLDGVAAFAWCRTAADPARYDHEWVGPVFWKDVFWADLFFNPREPPAELHPEVGLGVAEVALAVEDYLCK